MSAALAAAGGGVRVLSLYRRLLRHAGRLPAAERAPAVQQIRDSFRAGKAETSPERVAEMVADAQKRLGYLRIVTPRLAGDDEGVAAANAKNAGRQRYVVGQGGDLVPVDEAGGGGGGSGRGATSAGVHSLDPQDVKRHHANLRRFQFKNRPAGPF